MWISLMLCTGKVRNPKPSDLLGSGAEPLSLLSRGRRDVRHPGP
jgi:hypothetical protein